MRGKIYESEKQNNDHALLRQLFEDNSEREREREREREVTSS